MEYLDIKDGSIQFWGEWFGGRPFENYHKVTGTNCVKQETLIITFDQGEIVTIYDPTNIVSNEKEFSIEDATLIVFEWFYYGQEHTEENLCHLEYKSISDNEVLCVGTDATNRRLYKKGLLAMRIV